MNNYLSNNFTSLSAIRTPSLIPPPLITNPSLPTLTPINLPAPVIPQNSFRLTV
ncbi:hypothetical protein FDUTEX481_03578 [Tolypothrix sp. PCC 7601]|nr:hypothetical protein FDUTEX481_03578 [Tolypothrix sp. PCC 7601]